MERLKPILLAVSILISALLGGEPRMSLSALTAKRGWDRLERCINWLFDEPNHCWESYTRHLRRRLL